MKKILASAALAALAALAFSACANPRREGEIIGDYKEITAVELGEKLNTFGQNGLFGDSNEEDWKFGADIENNIGFEAEARTAEGGSPVFFCGAELTGQTQFVMTKQQENKQLKAKSSQRLAGNFGNGKNTNCSAVIYCGGKNVYFALSGLDGFMGAKDGKYFAECDPVKKVGAALSSLQKNTAELPEIMQKYKLKAFWDGSAGIKLKLSADQSSAYAALARATGLAEEKVRADVKFDTCTAELYLETDADGGFIGAGLIMDMDCKFDLGGEVFGSPVSGYFKLKADISAEKFAGEIILPSAEELAEYKKTDCLKK